MRSKILGDTGTKNVSEHRERWILEMKKKSCLGDRRWGQSRQAWRTCWCDCTDSSVSPSISKGLQIQLTQDFRVVDRCLMSSIHDAFHCGVIFHNYIKALHLLSIMQIWNLFHYTDKRRNIHLPKATNFSDGMYFSIHWNTI